MVEIIIAVLLIPAWDWLGVTRMAALYTDFDYRYWPLKPGRIVSVVLLEIGCTPSVIFANPDDPPLWLLIPAGIVLAIWAVVAVLDIKAQRKTGYRTPLDYGARDY